MERVSLDEHLLMAFDCEEHGLYFSFPWVEDPDCPECNPPHMEEAERDKRTRDAWRLENAGVNMYAYGHATLDNLDYENIEGGRELIDTWLSAFKSARSRWDRRAWLYLYGADSGKGKIGRMGNGKTHCGIAIARHLYEEGFLSARHYGGNEDYRFVTAETLLLEIEASYDAPDGSALDVLERYTDLGLLQIDDLGVRSFTDHSARVLQELSVRREGRATIWTSNLSPRALSEDPRTARMVSRIVGETLGGKFCVRFSGPDWRLSKKEETDE